MNRMSFMEAALLGGLKSISLMVAHACATNALWVGGGEEWTEFQFSDSPLPEYVYRIRVAYMVDHDDESDYIIVDFNFDDWTIQVTAKPDEPGFEPVLELEDLVIGIDYISEDVEEAAEKKAQKERDALERAEKRSKFTVV